MAVLIDTSVLARLANSADTSHKAALLAVQTLHRRGERLHTTPQILIEFRNVATRPFELNGLGLSIPVTEAKAAVFEQTFPIMPETQEIYPTWKSLVHAAGVVGKQVHDARLVAVCQVLGIEQILTFNTRHFMRFANFAPEITVVAPNEM